MTLGTHYLGTCDTMLSVISSPRPSACTKISGATHPSSFHAHPAPSSSGCGTEVLLLFVWHVGEYVRLQID